MKKILFLLFIISLLTPLVYAKSLNEYLQYIDAEMKSNFDLTRDFEITSSDSLYFEEGTAANTISFSLEIFANITRLSIGGGVTYQVPTFYSTLGDFAFIPVYYLLKLRLFDNKETFSLYGIYNYGKAIHKGGSNYTREAELVDGEYHSYGLGFSFGENFVIEFANKYNSGKRSDELYEDQTYNMDVDYSTFTISFGIKNDFSYFFYNFF